MIRARNEPWANFGPSSTKTRREVHEQFTAGAHMDPIASAINALSILPSFTLDGIQKLGSRALC
ncbi:protein of unknown function (plasmid) [Caballeronia sp. S22]